MTVVVVGVSQLSGRTFGVAQIMEQTAGVQVIGMLDAFEAEHGYRLSTNEGIRSRPVQDALWTAWETRAPGAVLAARPYTSYHDETRGGAIDLGGPHGAVLTQAEHDWLVERGPAYGVTWTGKTFIPQEWWHFQADRSKASIVVPLNHIAPASLGDATPITLPKGFTMDSLVIRIGRAPVRPYDSYLVNVDAQTAMPLTSDKQEQFFKDIGCKFYDKQPASFLKGFTLVKGNFK